MKFPSYIQVKERVTEVLGFIEPDTDYIDGKGYVDQDGQCWIYSASGKPFTNVSHYPYFWKEGDTMEFSTPSADMMEWYHSDNLMDMSFDVILEESDPDEQLYDERILNDMNSSAAVYVPEVNDDDDFLKKLIKTAIIKKGIDLSRIKSRLNEKYVLPNMKSALSNKTKMSTSYFCNWCELLGLDFYVEIQDNGTDNIDPLKVPLSYVNTEDKVKEG